MSFFFQVCSLEFDRQTIKMNKLLATSLEGGISVFETRNREEDIPCVTKNVIFLLQFC